MSVLEALKTARAAWPILKRAIISGQLFRPQCTLIEPDPDIRCDVDVQVPIGGGVVLTANVFRSKARADAGTADPVIMCAHPYDNHLTPALGKTPLGGPPQQYRLIPQAGGTPEFSTLTSWESPDPNFWVPAGYTLVNLNLPGYANSGGDAGFVSDRQGEDYYAAIKWVGGETWCDGNIGLSGVSYLAISQYHAAVAAAADGAASPLKCISPWEGMSDPYRDVICRGGVEDRGFLNFWWHTEVKESLNNPVDEFADREGALPPDILAVHPLYDDYWAAKAVDFSKVVTPLLVCASFSDHELHTNGSFRAFEKSKADRKWVYTHRTGKWTAFYSDEVKALLKDFMDHHLKGVSNRFDTLPPVRLEVRSGRDQVKDVRWEQTWPLPTTDYRPLYLASRGLVAEKPGDAASRTYPGRAGSAEFDVTFDQDTEISGYMKLRVWVEVRAEGRNGAAPDDMTVCAFVDKRDAHGHSVRFNGAVGITDDIVTRGYMRASRRALDPDRSTDWHPVPLGNSEELLAAGEIVPLEIALSPSSTFFAAGERLRLIVSASEFVGAPVFHKDTRLNSGTHVLHFGGPYDAHLLVPIVPSNEMPSS
ncbi:MAG: CocE/NonD family hydrolase [Pseudomonadota bacterium]